MHLDQKTYILTCLEKIGADCIELGCSDRDFVLGGQHLLLNVLLGQKQ